MESNLVFYEQSIVDVVDIEVETGFASSPGNEGIYDEEGNGSFNQL